MSSRRVYGGQTVTSIWKKAFPKALLATTHLGNESKTCLTTQLQDRWTKLVSLLHLSKQSTSKWAVDEFTVNGCLKYLNLIFFGVSMCKVVYFFLQAACLDVIVNFKTVQQLDGGNQCQYCRHGFGWHKRIEQFVSPRLYQVYSHKYIPMVPPLPWSIS